MMQRIERFFSGVGDSGKIANAQEFKLEGLKHRLTLQKSTIGNKVPREIGSKALQGRRLVKDCFRE